MSVIFINPYRFGYTPTDADAAAYIARVEGVSGDNQELEPGVRQAIDEFVIGCKADGIWNAIKASCILAGARTLNGALQPLVGPAPTSVNFAAGDYDRKTGLRGNGSTKYLNSNRNNNADPQNSKHISAYFSEDTTANSVRSLIGNSTVASGGTWILQAPLSSNMFIRLNAITSASFSQPTIFNKNSLVGVSRSNSLEINYRQNKVNTLYSSSSTTPLNQNILVFSGPELLSLSRLAFYSIGESLDLALLDARVTALINAFAAAIPS